ncbi:MAG: hypothetical protein KF789_02410 [Bdellovibrionaceae bacterium]|nr:hypothetical protein [Pseudobdellovibrionaceae bacterium]
MKKAVFLTNGHCLYWRWIPERGFFANRKYGRSEVYVFNRDGQKMEVRPGRILYGTAEISDIALIELETTYRDLAAHGVKIYEIAKAGINVNHADLSCRALSAIQGLLGRERPTCWYNPSPQ